MKNSCLFKPWDGEFCYLASTMSSQSATRNTSEGEREGVCEELYLVMAART